MTAKKIKQAKSQTDDLNMAYIGSRHNTNRYIGMSTYYFLYFSTVAVFSPYFNLYLVQRGVTSSQVGLILAMIPLIGLLVQPLWGILNDSLRLQKLTVYIGLMAAPSLLFLFPYLHGFSMFLLMVGLLAIFQTGVTPVMDSLTVQNAGVRNYGKVRMFGSLGYAVMVGIAGHIYGSSNVDRMVPLYALASGLALLGLVFYPTKKHHRERFHRQGNSVWGGLRRLMKNRAFVGLLLFTMLVSVSQAVNNNFFTLYYRGLNHPMGVLGIIYSVGALSELPLFFVSGRWIERFGAEKMLLLSSSVFVFRWVVLALGPPTWVLFVLQMLHGLSFGVGLAAGVSVANHVSNESNRVTAQTVYSAVNTGLAAIIGSTLGGLVLQLFGPKLLFGFAAIVATLGVLGMLWLLRALWSKVPS